MLNNFTYLLVIFLLVSCVKEDFSQYSYETTWNPTISIPIRKMDLSTDDFNASASFYEYYQINKYCIISSYVDFNYSNLVDNYEELKYLLFRYNIINSFPARLEIETYFINGIGNVIHANEILIDNPIDVNAAQIDNDGTVSYTSNTNVDYIIEESQINRLSDFRRMLIVVYFYDLNENVNIINKLREYNVLINVGIRANIETTTEL